VISDVESVEDGVVKRLFYAESARKSRDRNGPGRQLLACGNMLGALDTKTGRIKRTVTGAAADLAI
jgi:hypothetical protein